MDREFLEEAAKAVGAKLPDNYGFILLAAPFNGEGDGRLVYLSTMKREDAIVVLKEFLIKASGEEEWLKHIK